MEKVDKVATLEFKWLNKRGMGGKEKDIQFYESFKYDGVEYALYDCVYMHKEGLLEPYIGKLVKIWERSDKTKKVKVHWFFRPGEISKWLGDTKTLENEILLASGEGVGLANINPLEAIAGQCNVVCVSKDCRNPQPSDEELKTADYIFYRTFDVQSCTISDKMDDKVGGLEIKYILNRKEDENINTFPQGTSDRKEENKNTTTCSEPPKLLTKKSPSNKLKDDGEDNKMAVKVDVKRDSQAEDIPNLLAQGRSLAAVENGSKSGVDSKKVDETNSEIGKTYTCIVKADKDNTKIKDMPLSKEEADKDEKGVSIVPVHKVEAKERNKCPVGFDKLHDRPLKKIKSDNKTPSKGKEVEVARDSDILAHGRSLAAVENSSKSGVDSKKVDETNSDIGKMYTCIVKADKDNTKIKDMPLSKEEADKDEKGVSIVPVHKVEAKDRNKCPVGFDKLHDRPLKKIKSDNKTPSKGKEVEVARDSDILKDMPSKKSKVNNAIKLPVDSKLKPEEKPPLHVNNLKALGTSGTTGEKLKRKNDKVLLGSDKGVISAKVTGDSEGRILKKARADSSLKMPDSKKSNSVQRLSIKTNGSNGKDVVAASAFSEGQPKSGFILHSPGTSKGPKREQSDESKRKLSMSKSPKMSASSTDEDKKTMYQEFVVGPKPNADKNGWFRLLPWEQRLKNAYDQGSAVLLHNVDPDYTSGEVEDLIWHAFTENCEAKILQHTAVSSPNCGQALILLKTKEAAQRVLTKLDEECLMLSNGRPLVGTTCPPISSRKNSKFFGHLAIDKIRLQNQREMDEAVATSHFSQLNTIECDMALEWFLLQSRSNKWWKMIHKKQGDELKKLETDLIRK